jgi:hypothetical protein
LTATIGLRLARGNTRKLPRVAKAFEVQQHDLSVWIISPVGQQVITRHVGFIADRDEGRDADVERLHIVEDRQTKRATLR